MCSYTQTHIQSPVVLPKTNRCFRVDCRREAGSFMFMLFCLSHQCRARLSWILRALFTLVARRECELCASEWQTDKKTNAYRTFGQENACTRKRNAFDFGNGQQMFCHRNWQALPLEHDDIWSIDTHTHTYTQKGFMMHVLSVHG